MAWKSNLPAQFIRLMEILCYTYFPRSASSIPSQQKNVPRQQNNFEETVKWRREEALLGRVNQDV